MTPTHCPDCGGEVSGSARFCMACGAPVGVARVPAGGGRHPSDGPGSVAPTRAGSPSSTWRSSSSGGTARFVAGHVLAGRYRITALLGRGGMGEVYRADDLKLDQPVALKFLPSDLPADPGRLARFHNEVRLARQVSHPNVCRVYDIGEADGQAFLTMEYVDGEDLASLLRRIGRFPADKGVDVARQICAGLAAAHDRGVLHRDLKPANIMIDGRGHARITDFGLAEAEGAVSPQDLRAGTPLYMAPEQLEGREVTVRSDIYSLGLVLYELFTGHPAFPTDSQAAWLRARRESTPATPGSVVPGIEPAIERTILRCLEKEPSARPASALAVSAALPGGDPLAAALAAGETPSPEMVAAAGAEEGALSPRVGLLCLAGIAVGVTLTILLAGQTKLVNMAGLDLPAQVLAQKAGEAIRALGHDAPVADTAYGFDENDQLLDWIQENDHSHDRWRRLQSGRPPGVLFWYRESPHLMVSKETFALVRPGSPPQDVPGMASAWLDPKGRLVRFDAVPGESLEKAPADGAAPRADWDRLFVLAGLERDRFQPSDLDRTPPVFCDQTAAWTGTVAEMPDVQLSLEACSLRGRPLHFAIHGPWAPPVSATSKERPAPFEEQARAALFAMALLGALFLARRNLQLGRGDRRGAFRIALYFTILHIVVWALWVSHVPSLYREWLIFGYDTGWTLFNAVAIWISYLAVEPYVRRLWPATIISWTRVLSGKLRDPRVGRDVLVGLLLGVACNAVQWSAFFVGKMMGMIPPRPEWGNAGDLLPVFGAAEVLDNHVHSILIGMQILSLLLLLKLLLRRMWLAGSVFVLVFTIQFSVGSEYPLLATPLIMVSLIVFTVATVRFGLLTVIAFLFALLAFGDLPLSTDLSSWHAGVTWAILAAIAGLSLWSFRAALGGQPAFGWLTQDAE
jgi:hypothetical protein